MLGNKAGRNSKANESGRDESLKECSTPSDSTIPAESLTRKEDRDRDFEKKNLGGHWCCKDIWSLLICAETILLTPLEPCSARIWLENHQAFGPDADDVWKENGVHCMAGLPRTNPS